ncbi:hypothetical protein [Endozoicomonas sp. 8E]|uniref:hypothetical protein n=1 Tax=Endozoicomonas sp. 8E TaxID=3035692 RepID=UPI0029394EA4|nr:hypothetical protein [Endozoicomonas sp. 8E]WOG29756.1 hypothetical protein P6910_08900 [Endozoicomonas sp. 8E]
MTFDELIEAKDLDSALMMRDMNFKAWYCNIGKFKDQCEALEALGFPEPDENIKGIPNPKWVAKDSAFFMKSVN